MAVEECSEIRISAAIADADEARWGRASSSLRVATWFVGGVFRRWRRLGLLILPAPQLQLELLLRLLDGGPQVFTRGSPISVHGLDVGLVRTARDVVGIQQAGEIKDATETFE